MWARLGALGRWTGGGTPSKSNAAYWTNGTIPWVSPKDMKTEIVGDPEDRITDDAVENSSTKRVPADSVLMVVRSGILSHTFPVAVCDREVTLNQDMRALTPREGINSKYLACVLRRLQRQILYECSKDGTTVASVDPSRLESIFVPIAPSAEQRRIAARIDELFTDIADGEAELARARDDLDTWRRALLKAAVTGELTRDWRDHNPSQETGMEVLVRLAMARTAYKTTKARSPNQVVEEVEQDSLPEIPDTWAWSRLGDLGEIVGGVTVDKKRHPADPVTVPYLRVANVQRGHLDLSEIKHITVERNAAISLRLEVGDILLNEGGDRDKIGRGWVWNGEIASCIHQNHVFRVRPYDRALNAYFISNYANEMGRRFFIEKGKQTTNLASISMSKISQLPVPVPPIAEMNEAMRVLDDAFAATADVEEQLRAASVSTSERQSILKAAFEGRLIAQDPRDEAAERLLARLTDQYGAQTETRHQRRVRRVASLAE